MKLTHCKLLRKKQLKLLEYFVLEVTLEDFLGLKVTIAADTDPRSGSVTIRYRTLDQLDLVCQRLTGGGI